MRIIDSHVHTKYCHGENDVFEIVEAAIEKGVEDLGFAEHFIAPVSCGEPTMFGHPITREKDQFDKYYELVQAAKIKFSDKIDVRLGAEVDYFLRCENEIAQAIEGYNFDFVIGSVHFLGKQNKYFREYMSEDENKLIEMYFESTKRLIKSGLFDILAHPELIKFGLSKSDLFYKAHLEEIADLLKEMNMAIEINTSNVVIDNENSIIETLNPGKELLKMCLKRDIPFVVGSDAHKTADITKSFEKILPIIKKFGIKKLAYYEKRKPIFYEI